MVLLKKRGEEVYLLTNYKVMYTALSGQENLEHIPFSRKITMRVLLSHLRVSNSKFYLLVRNPYARTESFFKNKFRQVPKRKVKRRVWQPNHKLFFPHLDLTAYMPEQIIAEKLLGTSFRQFISYLPDTYLFDMHLTPQYLATYVKIVRGLNLRLPIRFQRIFKMESSTDLKDLERVFKINLGKKVNSTESVKTQIEWGRDELEIMERLYATDFERFGYGKKTAKMWSGLVTRME